MAVLLELSERRQRRLEESFVDCSGRLLWDLAGREVWRADRLAEQIRGCRLKAGTRAAAFKPFLVNKSQKGSKNRAGATPGAGFGAKVGQGSLQQSAERKAPFLSSSLAD